MLRAQFGRCARTQRRMVPSTGNFFTPLRLVDAFLEYDEFFALSRRKYVPPNFAEIRHILNIAQVHDLIVLLGTGFVVPRCWRASQVCFLSLSERVTMPILVPAHPPSLYSWVRGPPSSVTLSTDALNKCFLCLAEQVHASAEQLRLITFDADGTLYADGAHMAQDNRMIRVSRLTRCFPR